MRKRLPVIPKTRQNLSPDVSGCNQISHTVALSESIQKYLLFHLLDGSSTNQVAECMTVNVCNRWYHIFKVISPMNASDGSFFKPFKTRTGMLYQLELSSRLLYLIKNSCSWFLCWCNVRRWIWCLWCYSECISTPGKPDKYPCPRWESNLRPLEY